MNILPHRRQYMRIQIEHDAHRGMSKYFGNDIWMRAFEASMLRGVPQVMENKSVAIWRA